MPYSTGLTTPMSNFEANQNFKDTIDPSGDIIEYIYNFFYIVINITF